MQIIRLIITRTSHPHIPFEQSRIIRLIICTHLFYTDPEKQYSVFNVSRERNFIHYLAPAGGATCLVDRKSQTTLV
jgi:hypothetical protein